MQAAFGPDEELAPVTDGRQRLWAALVHASALVQIPGPNVLLPLLIWLAFKDESEFLDDQGRQSIDFQLTMLILWLAGIPLLLVGVGFLILWVVPLINIFFVIWAAIQAAQGRAYRYPLRFGFL